MDVSGSKTQRLIWLHVEALTKPLLGQSCNDCGMMLQSSRYLRFLSVSWQAGFSRLVARWIAAGTACDSNVEVEVKPAFDVHLDGD